MKEVVFEEAEIRDGILKKEIHLKQNGLVHRVFANVREVGKQNTHTPYNEPIMATFKQTTINDFP